MKRIAIVAVITALIVPLAACTSSPGTSNTDNPTVSRSDNLTIDETDDIDVTSEDTDLASETTGDGNTETDETSEAVMEGAFVWWSYFDQAPFLQEQFNDVYPDITIELELFGGDEYQTKLLTQIQSGQDVPDLVDLEEAYLYRFIEGEVFADLGALGGDQLIEDYYPYAADMGRDSQGVLRAITDNVSPVAFWYLRDAMEEWLGTSDDEEISGILSDWDAIFEKAREIKEASDGTVYLWPNLEEVTKMEGYALEPFVRDGEFAIDDAWYEIIDIMRTLHEEELHANLGSWSGEWASAWNEGQILIRVMPSWDFFTDWETNEGNVGVAKPPTNSYEGANYKAIYNESEQKDAIMTFLTFMASSEYQKMNLDENNQMPANRSVIEEIGADFSAERFGGQNILRTYDEINQAIPAIIPDQYTRAAQNTFSRHAKEGVLNGLSDEEIIENFKDDLRDQFPEIGGL